jgi:hypothetical protein
MDKVNPFKLNFFFSATGTLTISYMIFKIEMEHDFYGGVLAHMNVEEQNYF